MPHLWMFLLQSLTPSEHKVFLIDGNAKPLTERQLADFVRRNEVRLAGIGSMTRMAARAYQMADAIRSAGAQVVMGGPHVTEVPDEPLGRDGEPRHADAVALGEADNTWPKIVADAARGELQEIYLPVDSQGQEVKPHLGNYPAIPWDQMDVSQFDLIRLMPGYARYILKRIGLKRDGFYVIPVESGRGCPYGCDFCTVTGFFGDSIRFRTNESVVDELLRLKKFEAEKNARVSVFFIDDNFAINAKRTKSLLREMIARDATLPWIAQISINLLRDPELVDLIQRSGGRWIFMGLESIDPKSLKSVNKGFNKPAEYEQILKRLAARGIYAITSFIFGMDGDRPNVAEKTLEALRTWPPGLPVFGPLTPYPSTPLYDRLLAENRLTRPKHWLDFHPFRMAFSPSHISSEQVEAEVQEAWVSSYGAPEIQLALQKIEERPFEERAILFVARLAFRGIYFPQMRARNWASVLLSNRRTIFQLVREAVTGHQAGRKRLGNKETVPVASKP